jgi:uncharacterized membrane protein HdeD (DUF308 family)
MRKGLILIGISLVFFYGAHTADSLLMFLLGFFTAIDGVAEISNAKVA